MLLEIKSLKGSWSNFLNLRTLDLSVNSNIEFQPGMFNGLVNLKWLNISSTNIKEEMLSNDFFNGLANLERLDMYNCKLTRLPDDLFSPLIRLQTLDIGFNLNITEINTNTFKSLKNLKELKLDNYEFLSIDLFIYFKNLESLTLNIYRNTCFSNHLENQLKEKYPNLKIINQT